MFNVKIIADSINAVGKRITTFELDYQRFIHAELLTHKMLSRNSASSRAIPVSKVLEQVRNDPAMPSYWGKNQPGMQAKEECNNDIVLPEYLTKAALIYCHKEEHYDQVLIAGGTVSLSKEDYWEFCAWLAAGNSEGMANAEYHKQIANRITEPFQWMKIVLTATEWNNCWHLRDHPDAQPEIQVLFHEMKRQYDLCEKTTFLKAGEWHLPYVNTTFDCIDGSCVIYKDQEGNILTEEQALRLSASCCGQVSYRKLDTSQEKADDIFKRLVESVPVHASPTEHANLCIDVSKINPFDPKTWVEGLTHVDKDGKLWSGNIQGWVQHRQLIPNNYLKG